MVRVVKQAEVRRSEIIDAAAGLFVARGYARTTVGGIIEAAGVAKGGFYHHFASKDEVFEACVGRLSDRLTAGYLRALTDESVPPRDRVRGYLEAAYGPARSAEDAGVLAELHGAPSGLHERVVDSATERLLPALSSAIRAGQDDGTFRFAGEAKPAAVAVLGALRGLHVRYADRPDSEVVIPHDVVVGFVERLLDTRARDTRTASTSAREAE